MKSAETATELLVKAVQALSTARTVSEIQEIVRHAARQVSRADGATFVLREGELCYYVDEDAIGPLWKGKRFPMEACISGWSMIHREPAVIEDIYRDSRIPVDAYRSTFVKSLVMVPIRSANPIGAIGTYWAEPHRPGEQEIKTLQALADTTSVTFENVDLYATLEKKVAQRTAELEVANQELKSFSEAVSHDLRSPLGAILGCIEIMRNEHLGELSEEARELLGDVHSAAGRMRDIVDGLLDLSRVTQASLQSCEVDLSLVTLEICGRHREASPVSVTVKVADGMTAKGDPRLLKVALENLISNAFKFSSKASAPRIEIGTTRDRPDGEIVFYIKDNGAGFDARYADKLFDAFQRLHTQDEFPGTGIGLATVQRVIARHSGRIWAESTLGEGATFFFSLPS